MCRLLAIVSATKARDELLEQEILVKFQQLAKTGRIPAGVIENGHKDGWGIAAFEKGKIALYERYAEDASQSTEYAATMAALQTTPHDAVLAHLRKASVGSKLIENTHPFRYKNFIFAHNGTIFDHQKIPLQPETEKFIQGTTDSERFFHYLMEQQDVEAGIAAIKNNLRYRSLNFMMSDGKTLWVLREAKEQEDYYTLYRATIGGTTVICSEKIVEGDWELLPNHGLVTVEIKSSL